jgi:hypothetical protein
MKSLSLFSIILEDAKAGSKSEILGSLIVPLVQSGRERGHGFLNKFLVHTLNRKPLTCREKKRVSIA